MRKIIVTEFVTLDGVMEAPGGEPTHPHTGWVEDYFDDAIGTIKHHEVVEADAHLLGRVTYESFAGAWPTYEGPMADRMNSFPKYVVSTTLRDPEWTNTTVLPDLDAVRELDALDVPVLKVASFEIVDLGLIRAAAATGRPLLISTGMTVLGEIEDALQAAVEGGAPAVGLMQCTSVYPAPAERINLRAMETMARAFEVPVGLSDHSLGIAVPIAAAALGAAFVEKHYTLDRTMVGPDHPFALEPGELGAMVAGIREAQASLGDGRKDGPSPEEREEMFTLGRRSLIAARDLPAGTVLEADMITTKRPGFGIAPKHLPLVIGRELKVDVEEDDILLWDMM
jgi:sialic acid synthase SpsE